MDKAILYLLESSVILTVLYLLYILTLRKETFFEINRFYLISILVFSITFPFLSMDLSPTKSTLIQTPITEISKARMSYYEALEEWSYEKYRNNGQPRKSTTESSPLIASIKGQSKLILWGLAGLYFIGLIVCVTRIAWSLWWIYLLTNQFPSEDVDGLIIVKVQYPIAPFSFMKYVFVHADIMDTTAYDQILVHERAHVMQRHSIDLIFVQLVAAFFWFNPVIWRLIKSLKTVHEYIADKQTITTGYSLVEYQTLLLRQLISNNSYGLVHNFNLSFIKKRITMMKNKKSGWMGKVKVALALMSTVVTGALIVQCNAVVEQETIIKTDLGVVSGSSENIDLAILPASYYSYDYDTSEAITFEIVDDEVKIEGVIYTVDETAELLESKDLPDDIIVVMNIDAKQTMKLIRDVHMVLRKANKRKLLLIGQTGDGKLVNSAMMLAPAPGMPMPNGKYLPHIDDAYAKANGIDILTLRLGDVSEPDYHVLVYDFVSDQIAIGKSNYVVQAKFDESDLYQSYLSNWVSINQGFNHIYEERAKEMFNTNFYKIDKELPQGKEQYLAVRKGVPRAISISED